VTGLHEAGMSEAVTTCITDKEHADPSFKAMLESSGVTLDQAKILIPAVMSCMTRTEFAQAVFSGAGLPQDQSNCLTGVIVSLSGDELAGWVAEEPAAADRVESQLHACMPSGPTGTTFEPVGDAIT
jgi:hypothetical protein